MSIILCGFVSCMRSAQRNSKNTLPHRTYVNKCVYDSAQPTVQYQQHSSNHPIPPSNPAPPSFPPTPYLWN